jgi:hypothetical protein
VNATLPTTTVLLRLRWLQLNRAFPPYGLVLLAVAVCAAVWLMHRTLAHDVTYAPYLAGGALLTVWGLHQRRPDLHFLVRHVPRARMAMAVEYGVLLLPVLWGLLLAKAWLWAAAWPLVLLVPWSPVVPVGEVRGGWLRKWIPAQLFEWKGLLQGSHPWSVLLWAAALALCWLPVLPLFLLGVLALMVAGAQEHCEPRAMLLATAADARTLLRTKVLGSVRLLLLVELPVLLAATVFQPQWWWVHALFGLGQLALVAYAVVLKYANYRPNTRLEANGANVAVAAVFAILPGLSVVPVIMLLTEVPKARANLNAYFHDHHR